MIQTAAKAAIDANGRRFQLTGAVNPPLAPLGLGQKRRLALRQAGVVVRNRQPVSGLDGGILCGRGHALAVMQNAACRVHAAAAGRRLHLNCLLRRGDGILNMP